MAASAPSLRELETKGYRFTNSTVATSGSATASVLSGSGKLHSVTVNEADVSGTIAIYDGTDSTGTLIASITGGTAVNTTLIYDVRVATGIFASFTAFTGNVTWSYIES
tara:strand:- start:515 stop:841 length:327 start_codon:yes stop_codon:yes gene_type:complete